VVKVETNLVLSDVMVLDKALRSVRGLTREDFIVSEDGKLQDVGAFSLGDDANMPPLDRSHNRLQQQPISHLYKPALRRPDPRGQT